MELVNDFTVNVPVDEAWVTLTDVERIAPCLPGAQLQEIEGDVYRGVVKVKVGPILASFKGQATFVEKDDANHKAVLKAEGRDTGGKGNASALITAALQPEGDRSTKVTVTTDLTITGKVAQFGRGALADVSTKLLGQFVEQLEATVLNQSSADAAEARASVGLVGHQGPVGEAAPGGNGPSPAPVVGAEAEPAPAATAPAAASVGVRRIEGPEAKPVDLIDAAGAPVAKRILPVVAALVVLFLVVRALRRRHH
jgi:carbon monoxide dehydrogenase subunit G